MADRADWFGTELCGVRIAGLSRGAGSNSTRAMGSFVLARHESAAGISPDHSAAGFSHRAAANDERLRLALQRYFDGLRNFSLGTRHCLSRTGKRLGTISYAGSRGVVVLPGDESADGPSGAPARAEIAETRSDRSSRG